MGQQLLGWKRNYKWECPQPTFAIGGHRGPNQFADSTDQPRDIHLAPTRTQEVLTKVSAGSKCRVFSVSNQFLGRGTAVCS
mmetsp:Transcript_35004/g.68925  ORF Transcript_35004/g.68925 Transcript_35004/m.68925 type:complete len:81 (-) Transcript_35004:602-844(-)